MIRIRFNKLANSKLQVYKCSLDWCQSAQRLLQGNEPPQLELHRGNEREEEVPGPEVLDLGQRGLQDRDALGHVDQHSRYLSTCRYLWAGNAHLNSEGGSISTADLLVLTG